MKFNGLAFGLAVALVGASLVAGGARATTIVFSNLNNESVCPQTLGCSNYPAGGAPPTATSFTLAAPTYITEIADYHYGAAANTPDTIRIVSGAGTGGATLGTWSATTSDSFGASYPYTYEDIMPDIELSAGTYTIVDANASTWSYNTAGSVAFDPVLDATGPVNGDYKNSGSGIAAVFAGSAPVPEPGSLTLMVAGLAGLCFLRRRKNV